MTKKKADQQADREAADALMVGWNYGVTFAVYAVLGIAIATLAFVIIWRTRKV